MDRLNRRGFLDRSARAGLAWTAVGAWFERNRHASAAEAEGRAGSGSERGGSAPVGAFTKSFQDWAIPAVCARFQDIGLDGLDLTVRPGGHIDPKDVAETLPRAHRAAKEAGLEILFLTTAITEPDRDAERILSTAADLGISRIKMGYYRYRGFGALRQRMDEVRRRIERVAKLAGRYGVLPCVHIHSGPYVPSHGTMLYELLRDVPPDRVGAYVDPLHMTLEGGGDGWRQGLDLLAPWIALCSVKNFAWEAGDRDRHGQLRWHTETVPVADGVCPLPEFVATLKETGFAGPYSLHSEYKGGHSFKDLSTQECLKQTERDLQFFRKLL